MMMMRLFCWLTFDFLSQQHQEEEEKEEKDDDMQFFFTSVVLMGEGNIRRFLDEAHTNPDTAWIYDAICVIFLVLLLYILCKLCKCILHDNAESLRYIYENDEHYNEEFFLYKNSLVSLNCWIYVNVFWMTLFEILNEIIYNLIFFCNKSVRFFKLMNCDFFWFKWCEFWFLFIYFAVFNELYLNLNRMFSQNISLILL